jgi:hypothetical protein
MTWFIEEKVTCFKVRDNDGKGQAYLHFDVSKGRAGIKLYARCEAHRIMSKIACRDPHELFD